MTLGRVFDFETLMKKRQKKTEQLVHIEGIALHGWGVSGKGRNRVPARKSAIPRREDAAA